MKVLFRMLASILPGVVVGLGVIAYLEREQLQIMWAEYSGTAVENQHDEDLPAEPLSRLEPIRVPEPAPKPIVAEPPPPAVENPVNSVVQVEEAPKPVVEPEPTYKPRDLAEVIGLESADRQQVDVAPEPMSEPAAEVVVEAEPAPVPPARVTPQQMPKVEPAEEAPVAEQQLTELIEQQRKVSEVLVDQLPVLTEQIANLSKPIENLAKQFNPLANSPEQSLYDVWDIEGSVDASGTEWLWNRGRQAFWEGDYEAAVESYRSLLQEEPRNPDAWGELGNIYYAKKDWVRALRAFGRAAVVLSEMGRLEEAQRITQMIRSIDPALAAQLEEKVSVQTVR